MSKYVRYGGKLYKAVDKVEIVESRKIKEIYAAAEKAFFSVWAQGWDEALEHAGDATEMALIKKIMSLHSEGQRFLKSSLAEMKKGLGKYVEYEKLSHQYKRQYE